MSAFKCHVCGGETAKDEFVSEVLEVDNRRVLVEHIPARVCTRCKEAAFSRQTTEPIRCWPARRTALGLQTGTYSTAKIRKVSHSLQGCQPSNGVQL